jgi:hypothetical protein
MFRGLRRSRTETRRSHAGRCRLHAGLCRSDAQMRRTRVQLGRVGAGDGRAGKNLDDDVLDFVERRLASAGLCRPMLHRRWAPPTIAQALVGLARATAGITLDIIDPTLASAASTQAVAPPAPADAALSLGVVMPAPVGIGATSGVVDGCSSGSTQRRYRSNACRQSHDRSWPHHCERISVLPVHGLAHPMRFG